MFLLGVSDKQKMSFLHIYTHNPLISFQVLGAALGPSPSSGLRTPLPHLHLRSNLQFCELQSSVAEYIHGLEEPLQTQTSLRPWVGSTKL